MDNLSTVNKLKPLPLKYQGYAITLQEVPDEISLTFNISGCPYKCPECHSQYLWKYEGRYIGEDFTKILSAYKDYISCVCFMGGDQNIKELYSLCEQVKENNLKVCIYSGTTTLTIFDSLRFNNLIDYLKIGPYINKLGGLNSPSTNQVMYKVSKSEFKDITCIFQKSKI